MGKPLKGKDVVSAMEMLRCHNLLPKRIQTDNAFIESFNGSLQDECLNIHWFPSLEDTREKNVSVGEGNIIIEGHIHR
ncbi:hypothetical protein BJK05_09695 [Pectobacterium polaris]|nr:hypothetical protein BJK05_09695 [Pectobacterium polaris]